MPKQREPIDVILAKGRKHFTKIDIENRRAEEPSVPFKNIEAPTYLSKAMKAEFYDIAGKLLAIGVMTELDEDSLARYLIAKKHYLKYSKLISKAIKDGDLNESARLINTQDKLYKQVRGAAQDLGRTITSRCKLVIPEAETDVEL